MLRKSWLAAILCFTPMVTVASEQGYEVTETGNQKRAYYSGQIVFGQSVAAGKSRPGFSFLLSGGGDFTIERDSWDRFELGFELGTGQFDFKKNSDSSLATVPIFLFTAARIGTGYSLGQNMFAVWRLSAGPSWSRYRQKSSGVTFTSVEPKVGFLAGIDLDIVAPFDTGTEIIGGISFRNLTLNIDQIEASGEKFDLNETFFINFVALKLGIRFLP